MLGIEVPGVNLLLIRVGCECGRPQGTTLIRVGCRARSEKGGPATSKGRWFVHAAVIDAPGGPALYGEFADPPPDDKLTEVHLVAAALHAAMRSLADGTHYGSGEHWPLIPGIDAVASTASGAQV